MPKEYIERERLLNVLERNFGHTGGTAVLKQLINAQPAADVVEVVRCENCIHQRKIWHSDNRMKEKGYYLYSCERNSDLFVCHTVDGNDNDFCSFGKRKDGAE